MDSMAIKVTTLILQHHGIPFCFLGEIALNYYNVPRVRHDIEVCVPNDLIQAASELLLSTGLFRSEEMSEYNNFTDHKRGMPRFVTAGWVKPDEVVVLFPDTFWGLDPLDERLVAKQAIQDSYISPQILDDGLSEPEVRTLPMPRLPPLLQGLAQRYLDKGEDMPMIMAEQLVDGMNVDEAWCEKHLAQQSNDAVVSLLERLVSNRQARLDYFSGNKVTCFIRDEEEAGRIRKIAGYD